MCKLFSDLPNGPLVYVFPHNAVERLTDHSATMRSFLICFDSLDIIRHSHFWTFITKWLTDFFRMKCGTFYNEVWDVREEVQRAYDKAAQFPYSESDYFDLTFYTLISSIYCALFCAIFTYMTAGSALSIVLLCVLHSYAGLDENGKSGIKKTTASNSSRWSEINFPYFPTLLRFVSLNDAEKSISITTEAREQMEGRNACNNRIFLPPGWPSSKWNGAISATGVDNVNGNIPNDWECC